MNRKDQTLVVQLISLEGFNFEDLQRPATESGGWSRTMSIFNRSGFGCTVVVEIVAAVPPTSSQEPYTREFSYFAPRISTYAQIDIGQDTAKWPDDEVFTFGNFLVPPGGEDHIFVCFSINWSGSTLAEAYAPMTGKEWEIVQGGGLQMTLSLPLVPFGSSSRSPPESSKLRVRISIPVNSRFSQFLDIAKISLGTSSIGESPMSPQQAREEDWGEEKGKIPGAPATTKKNGSTDTSGEQAVPSVSDRIRVLEGQVAALTSLLAEVNERTGCSYLDVA